MFLQVGLLLLSKVVESNPEPFEPHYRQLLQLFGTVLQNDLDNPTALYYCILTLTAITAYTGTEEMVRHHRPISGHHGDVYIRTYTCEVMWEG